MDAVRRGVNGGERRKRFVRFPLSRMSDDLHRCLSPKPFDRTRCFSLLSLPFPANPQFPMGQQSNKVIKRRRRIAYLERKKVKAKEAVVVKPKPRRAAAPKKKEAPKAAPVAEPTLAPEAVAAGEAPAAPSEGAPQ